jgi:hypothetical protein
MALFGRRPRPAGLLTGLMSPEGAGWGVSWVSDGSRQPKSLRAGSLTEAVRQAVEAALACYRSGPPQPGAELQLALFPWLYGRDAPMYDISGGPGQYRARDIQGSDSEITAETLEGLVAALAREPGGNEAMLRWILPFAGLEPDGPSGSEE